MNFVVMQKCSIKKIIITVTLALSVAGCAKPPTTAEMATWDYGPYPSNYEEIVKDSMLTILFDPYSAQYHFQSSPSQRWFARPFGQPTEYGWGGIVLVNAKNRMGGYVGAKPYAYLIRNGRLVVLEENFNMK